MQEIYYFERVLPNPLALMWTLFVPVSFYLVFLPINETAGLVIGAFTFAAVLAGIWFAAPVIEISNGSLSVANASVPIYLIERVELIAESEAFAERGPKLLPTAFVRFQPTVKNLVKVYLKDQEDPTPYWLFASRKGETIKTVLQK